jgi:hypothetical protein
MTIATFFAVLEFFFNFAGNKSYCKKKKTSLRYDERKHNKDF